MRLELKLALSGGLLAWLLLRSDFGQMLAAIRGVPAGAIAAVALIILVEVAIASIRWWILVPHQSMLHVARLTLVGIFYGMLLPGQVAGETVKAYRLGAGQPDAERLAASVLVDKVNGLIALSALGLAGAALSQLSLPRTLWSSFGLVLALFIIGLYAICVPLLRRSIEAISAQVSRFWSGWNPLARRLALFGVAWTDYSLRPGLMLGSIALAMVYHLLAIAIVVILAASLDISIPLPEWAWIFAVVSLATLLPVSLGGLGVREGVFVATLGLLQVPSESALALSFAVFGSQMAMALLGALLETTSLQEKRHVHR